MDLATIRERRSGLIGTVIFHLLLLIMFLIAGLEMEVPRPEEGILLNFGTSDVGSGDVQPDQPSPVNNPDPNPTPTQSNPTPTSTDQQQMTQDDIETVEVPDNESNPEETQPKEKEAEEEPKEQTLDPTLSDILNKSKESMSGGGSEGNDDRPGDKGKLDGSKDGKSYTGNGTGNYGEGDYKLGGRVALSKIKPDYECDETGTVVVKIKVNREGKTLGAELELRGTTNSASCLVEKAIQAARKTRWESNPNAPEMQYGSITYRFQLQ